MVEIVAGQRDERRRIPCVQVHPDLAGAAGEHVAPELDKRLGHRHFIVRKVDGLETESLAQRLEARQVLRVARGDLPGFRPEVVALGVDRDDERRVRHGALWSTRANWRRRRQRAWLARTYQGRRRE